MTTSNVVGSPNATELVHDFHIDIEMPMISGDQNEAGTLVLFNPSAFDDQWVGPTLLNSIPIGFILDSSSS